MKSVMNNFAQRIARLSPKRQELLARLLEQERLDFSRTVINPRKRELAHLPLSYAQQRLWFLDQLEPQRSIYNIPESHYFEGALNLEALERSLSEIVRRHEILRTTFASVAGEPMQVIAAAEPLRLEVIDLSRLPAPERENEAQRLANEEAQQPFDLALGPLLRVKLLRLAEAEHVLLLTMHHIVADGWSIGVLERELTALYAAYSAGQSSPLEELTIQYADFALWQREWLQGEVLEKQLGYWREQLGGELPVLELPTDRPRPARQTYRGAVAGLELSEAVSRRLQEISRESGATRFMTLLAAFNVLLWRYSQQSEILIGTPIANRNRAEMDDLIGFFVNTLVIRTRLNGELSFRELLEQVRETTLGAYEHQDMPFEMLVEELQPERSLSRQPVFQVMFALQDEEELKLAGLELSWLQTEIQVVKFDLTLTMAETEGKLGGGIIYNIDLFDAATIKRMARQLELLLEAIVANPQQRLSELPLLTAAEQQTLADWNQTQREYADDVCIHELFERQAQDTPEAVALVFNEERLTYRELNCRANQVARYLRGVGVGAEVLVGILVERSVELVVAVLGILKAGGAFVPLNPTYPEKRLRFMLDDAGLSILLTQKSLLTRLPAEQNCTAICLDSGWAHIAAQSAENLNPAVTPNNLAYVIYTSGSTGQPKGVLIQHRGVLNLAAAQAEAFAVSAESRVLQFASISFDAIVSEIFKTLLTGATLCLATAESLLPVEPLLNLLRTQSITMVTLPPSVWAVLPGESLPALHTAISAGEPCSAEIAAAWGAEGRRFLNAYGPTEVTVCATISECLDGSCRPPIGRPIANTEVYVLDANLRPVPIGVVGELYVGGVGLARGYLRQPALTAERFVPHPFSGQPGARLYRTGDLARYWKDGNLEYLGRIDQQVKMRGFRIELGEIENALAAHPAVRDVVVLVREDVPGDKRLVAYLVTESGATADVSQWRAWLSQKLPEYMLPAAFVLLPEFPLTPNGKVDRRALPAPDASRPQQGQAYVAPRDRLEQLLVDLWQPALGLKQVGVNDNFFDIGGNSIKGAILINRLQELLGEYVYVVAIFDAPTVAELADYLRIHYPTAVNRICGFPVLAPAAVTRQISSAQIAEFKQLIPTLAQSRAVTAQELKNPPAIFVLSPPRSGSTLLRVMLGGHPRLFAPPELELLSFNTLAERRAAFAERFSFWLEGTLRALMQINQCDADEARALMQQCEGEQLTTKQFYALLQSWLGNRVLVDKTPSYALDIEILRRAESDFAATRYIHLIRHPYAVIRSFEEARLEQVFFRHQHGFSRRELAELIWLVSQANIIQFLETIPAERQHQVHYEQLVKEPERVLRGVCKFLGLEYVSEMAAPYREPAQRMADGIHPLSKMLGDVKFHEHTGVDAAPADRWQQQLEMGDALGDETWAIAERLGYPRVADEALKAVPISRQESQSIRQVKEGRDSGLPLSFAQQRLWVIDQLEPVSSAYNIPLAEHLSGPLNVPALERSFTELIRRHESLRTTFQILDRHPVQVMAPPQPLRLETIDLSRLPAPERESEAQRLVNEEAQQPFDLAHGPLLRVKLLKLEAGEHLLLVTMHHIITDGWSIGVLERELTALYAAYSAGQSSPLEELTIQYADFAVWQREWLQGEVLEKQLGYWREQLGGELPVLELPTDRPRPAIQTYHGDVEVLELSEEVSRRLQEISRESGATRFMTLLAAFNVLLWRYTGQTDICIGTPIAGRNRSELEQLNGFFVNTLVLRTRLSGESDFRDLLRQVKNMTRNAYEHQDVPFEKLVDELQPPRDPSHTPLFQVMFTLDDALREELKLAGLEVSWTEPETQVAKFDLSLAMTEEEGFLTGAISYNTDLFDAATIKRMARNFELLLAGIAANPQQRLAKLPLPTAVEQQMLADWNETQREYADQICIHELFERQVALTPEAVAVVFNETRLSYRELNERANQLAHYLRGVGVGPEVLVGILIGRSVEMIVGLLGVLKAGGAYVPLDPQYPAERLSFMIDDAETAVLITQADLLNRIAGAAVKQIIIVEQPDWRTESRENLSAAVRAENLAYVIYTSGSTGRPKGVAIEHHSAATLLYWARETFTSEELLGVLASTSICFDLSVFELFVPLSWGGAVILAENALALPTLNAKTEVRLINTVPSAISELVRLRAIPDQVRVVNLAGEALQRKLVEELYEQQTIERVVNLYGPSEDTTYSTYAVMKREEAGRVVIGRPIAKTRAYVVDERGAVVPLGVAGELCLGGEGLARGYLKRTALTAEKFIPDELSGQIGARLYRTGDLARYLADGNIEYLGRIDDQVKIRGYRIEPGEIEARLRQHEAVQEGVVLVQKEVSEEKRLVAYVVANQEVGLTADELRRYLRQTLPEYMIPSAFVLLDEMPFTPNGKINRQALPALAKNGDERQETFVAPRDALELQLQRLWEDLLNVRPIGITDNFFDLGGHSLLAVRMMAQLSDQIGRELPLVLILQQQTIQGLASLLRQQVEPQATSPLVAIQPDGWKQPFFCVHPAGGSVICYLGLSRHLGLEQPFYGMQTPGLDDPTEAALTRIEEMAARYIEELRTVQGAGPYKLGGWSMGGVVAFEMAQQLRRQGQEVSLLALFDSRVPTSLGRTEIDEEGLLLQFTSDISGLYGLEQSLTEENSQSRGVEEHLRVLLEQVVRAGSVPRDFDLKQLSRRFQVFQMNMCAMLRYERQRYPGRITFFRASEQLADVSQDAAKDWQDLAADGVEIHVVPGNHYTMLREPQVQVVAEWLKVCLDITGNEIKPPTQTIEIANAVSL